MRRKAFFIIFSLCAIFLNAQKNFIYQYNCKPISKKENFDSVIADSSKQSFLKKDTLPFPETSDLEITKKNTTFGLFPNSPNPFNPSTEISFRLEKKQAVDLSIYNIKGQKVKSILHETVEAGKLKSVVWDGTDCHDIKVGSGIYYYLLKTAKKIYLKKMLMTN